MLNVLLTSAEQCNAALGLTTGIDEIIPTITSSIVTIVKVAIPLLLIFLGMIDLGKAVLSNDEKDMKAAQGKLIKRFIYAVVIFLLVAIVQLVFGLVAQSDDENGNITHCIDYFISGPEKE